MTIAWQDTSAAESLEGAIRLLMAEAERLGIVGSGPAVAPAPAATSAAEAAAGRLLAGAGHPSDESWLPFSLTGARLLWVAGCPAGLTRVRRDLGEDRHVVVDRPDGLVVLTRPVPRWGESDQAVQAARRVAARLLALDAGVRVGVSAAANVAGDLPALLADAREALDLPGRDRIVLVEEEWAELTLLRMRSALAASLACGNPIAKLLARDDKGGAELVSTLAAWLRHDRDTAAAAAELHLHPNTLRYRLRRVGELTGLDLDDARQRVVVELLLAHS